MTSENDAILCAKYPKLLRDRNAPMEETCMCWGFECGDGWFFLLDKLFETIQSYLDCNNKEQVILSQVKEKFGTLRVYCEGADDIVYGMIWFAERLSANICEICGEKGKLNSLGWIKCRCDKHLD